MKKLIKLFLLIVIVTTFCGQRLIAQTGTEEKMYMVEQVYFFDELDYAFYQSYNAFMSGHDGWSAAKLKRAAYFVRLEADNAKAHNKKPIQKQAQRLESLADSIALGKINSSWKLRKAYGRTHNILAKNYNARAAAFWADEKAEDTGHAMIAAAGHLGHAAKWTGKKVEQGAVGTGKAVGKAGKATGKAVGKTGKAVGKGTAEAGVASYRGIRWLGGKMIQGIAFVPTKVGQGLEWLGKGIDKVGEEVEPKPKKKKNK